MSNVNLSADTASIVKAHYQKELAEALQKVRELQHVLSELEGVKSFALKNENFLSAASFDDTGKGISNAKKPAKSKSTSTRKKKRGRKSFWPKFILNRLESTQMPLTYDDMTNQAIAIKNLDITKFENIKKTVIASAFNMRTKEHSIDNYAIKGSRTKYMCLPNWFEKEGVLLAEYRDKLK